MDIRSALKQGKPLLFDGAMGTYFNALTGLTSDQCERANLDRPKEILAIHRTYLEAGCRAIKTNTFAVGVEQAEGSEALGMEIIRAGCRIAKEAAKPFGAWVFADMGPVPQGKGIAPAEAYCRQAKEFLAQGVTNFLVETLPTSDGIPELAQYLKKQCPESFLIVSFAVSSDGVTWEGRRGAELFRQTAQLPGVDAVGYNCVSGPHHILEQIRSTDISGVIVSAMPNVGYPTVVGHKTVFQGAPDYFAEKMVEIVQSGAAIVGGCCGTTPQHMACLAAALSKPLPARTESPRDSVRPQREKEGENPLWDKLSAGKRVVAVELDPPVDDDIGFFLDGVRTLRAAGADAVTIADCPVGRPRADSSLLACKVKRELGVEPLPHMACRDRNLNATKALLLGLSIEGVHNVLLVTGDPIPTEDRSEVKSVFNFNSRKLARYVSGLNESTLTTPFRIFGALNLNARNFSIQLKMAQEKEACGVEGFLTQPVLSAEALENLKLARETLKGKLLGGVFPVVSYKNACFLNNEISGMRVCEEIVALYKGKEREEAEDLAVRISARVIREIEPYTDGVYLMTPFRRVALIQRILEEIQ